MLGRLILLVAACLAVAYGHSCGTTLFAMDVGYNSIRFEDGEYGVPITNYDTLVDAGHIRLRHPGVIEIGYAPGIYSAFQYLGNVNTISAQFGGLPTTNDASTYYSLRTNPELCAPSTAGCRTEARGNTNGTKVYQDFDYASSDLVTMTQTPKELTCSNGDIFLIRLGSGPDTDLVYLKIMFTDHTNNHHGSGGWSSVTFRWSNLYNRQSNVVGKNYCDISSSYQPLLTHVAWTTYYAPFFLRTATDTSGIEAVLIIYLIAFVLFLLVILALAYWVKGVSKDHMRLAKHVMEGGGGGARPPAPGAGAAGTGGASGNPQELSDFA